MFALGPVTSVHCVSMCGPLILAYAVRGSGEGTWRHRLMPNAAYHGARFMSYALIGMLLGAVGSVFNFDAVRPYALYLAGALMIVLALGMTGRVRWAQYLTPRPPRFLVEALRKTRRKAAADAQTGEDSLATPVVFGLLTGILPCGPAIAAELAAAATGNPVTGGLGMLAFGLGTAPLLMAFGSGASLIPLRFKERLNLVLALAVMVWGAVFLNQALVLTGSPVTFQAMKQVVLGGPGAAAHPKASWTTAPDGVVEVSVAFVDMKFVPHDVQIPANSRVRLVVDRRTDSVGANEKQIAIPQLHVLHNVEASATTPVDIPPTKAGTYALTCGMGVMEGTLVAIEP
jgi:uncharacterized protein